MSSMTDMKEYRRTRISYTHKVKQPIECHIILYTTDRDIMYLHFFPTAKLKLLMLVLLICIFLCSQLHHLVKQYFRYIMRETLM